MTKQIHVQSVEEKPADPEKQAKFVALLEEAGRMLSEQEATGCVLFAVPNGKGVAVEFINHADSKCVHAIGQALGETIGESPLAGVPIMAGITQGMENAKKEKVAVSKAKVEDPDDFLYAYADSNNK